VRTLYYVPIMHTPEELGSLAEPLMEIEKQVHGPRAEKIYREKVNQVWAEVTRQLKKSKLNTPEKCKRLHIYMDGLTAQFYCCKTCLEKTGKTYYMDEIEPDKIRCPVCGRITEAPVRESLLKLVQSLIEQRLPQCLIAQKLLEKGATIHGTESRELLLEEHNMWQGAAKGINPDPKRETELLKERDEFIAKIINETLPKDGIGILFIGTAHKTVNELKKFPDIKVIYL